MGTADCPHISLGADFLASYNRYIEYRRSNCHSLPVEKRYYDHRVCIDAFTLVAHRSFWARWLYLERALELASNAGDLLFGAIVLRTMAEDVWSLLELSRMESVLKSHPDVPTEEDLNSIEKHGDLLWYRFLPPIQDIPGFPDSKPPAAFEGPNYMRLREAFRNLNDYVHPNYGSFLLALFPETTVALRILLDSYITIYDAFFQVPWVENPVQGPFTEMPDIVLRSSQEEARFLQNYMLPEIQQHRAHRGLALASEHPAPNLMQWYETLSRDNSVYFREAWKTRPEWFIPLRELAEFILGKSDSDKNLCASIIGRTDFGIPMHFWELAMLTGARRLALEFENLFPKGRPSPECDQIQWFRFCQKAIELALTTTQYKMVLMTWASIRQLNDRNPVGSILGTRSLIEHYAVAVYIGERLRKAWGEIAKRSSGGTLAIDRLTKLEEDIASFIAGTKGTEEELTVWKEAWARVGLDKAINLRSATEQGLREDVLGYLYDFGSDVIHGRKARGLELCPPSDDPYLKANLSRALLALDELSRLNRNLDIIQGGGMVLRKMGSLSEALSKPGVDRRKVIKTALTPAENLRHGLHYSGKGTMDEPFTFVKGLEYYDAFYRLCAELQLKTEQRKVVRIPNGRFLDAVPNQKGDLHYFITPIKDNLSESSESDEDE